MTAIEAHEPGSGDIPPVPDHAPDLDGVGDAAAAAMVIGGAAGDRAVAVGRAVAVDPAVVLARRFLALEGGNAAQRQLAGLLRRGLELAEAIGRPDESARDQGAEPADGAGADPGAAYACDARPDHADAAVSSGAFDDGSPGASAYRVALLGVDAVESLDSAVAAVRARLIAQAYGYARAELLDGDLSPGQRRRHADGTCSSVLSQTQITGADLAVIVNLPVGLAKARVVEAARLVHDQPHTLARLEDGQLSSYQQRLITAETAGYSPQQAQRPDELVCGRAFAGREVGPGQHRVASSGLRRRLSAAVDAIGHVPAERSMRRSGHAGRYLRFGLTGSDGMTRVHGSLPALHAKAIDTLLDDLARTAPPGDRRNVEQTRADAFLTCFTGPAALAPPAQLALGLSAASFDEHGPYVVVDEPQNLHAAATWHTIRLLGATLGLTFPDVPRATVNIDVTLETLTGHHHDRPAENAPRRPCRPDGATGPVCPADAGPRAELCRQPGDSEPDLGPPDDGTGLVCVAHGGSAPDPC